MFAKETHVLVVDDSLNIRRIVVDSLQRLGFQKVTTAEDAVEALGKLKFFAKTPHAIGLVLSDLNMPGPSGLDFLKQVRSEKDFITLPFVLVTTESEKGAVIEAAAAGVSGYVVKPFNLETLTKKIKDAWRKHNPDAAG
ncbi:MAG: response regulator [Bdellovibrionales bacterium]|nr:response regulator [Bdellovibrionales bacterium]